MSILIKDVDMPKNCYECFAFKPDMFSCMAKGVMFGKEDAEWLPLKTPDWCPLVKIKTPHGDLIDRDTAAIEAEFNTKEPTTFRIKGDVIIEAEE